MMAFRVVRERSVLYLDTPLEPQLHKPNRLWKPGRVMGESPGITLILLGALPASAGPRNIGQAYGQQAEGSFPVLGPLWKVGQRRLALSGGQDCPPCPVGAVSTSLMQPCVLDSQAAASIMRLALERCIWKSGTHEWQRSKCEQSGRRIPS
jgi:hypothetical protein